MFRASSLLLVLALAATGTLAGTGCAMDVPGIVDGEAAGADFTIRDESPELRPQNDGESLVVLAAEVFGELRLVQLRVPADDEIALDEPLEVGAGGVELLATFGTAERFERSDGVTVLNTTEYVTLPATSGAVTFRSLEPVLAAEFSVVLDDEHERGGGALDGSFVVAR